MKKFDWNQPMTRKDYAVLFGWSFGISMIFWVIYIGSFYWDEIRDLAGRTITKIRTKLPW